MSYRYKAKRKYINTKKKGAGSLCQWMNREKNSNKNPVDILNIASVFNWSKWIFMVVLIFFFKSIDIGELYTNESRYF